jgi:uncharacterized membrane protein YoaK (UPF0700 family)
MSVGRGIATIIWGLFVLAIWLVCGGFVVSLLAVVTFINPEVGGYAIAICGLFLLAWASQNRYKDREK